MGKLLSSRFVIVHWDLKEESPSKRFSHPPSPPPPPGRKTTAQQLTATACRTSSNIYKFYYEININLRLEKSI